MQRSQPMDQNPLANLATTFIEPLPVGIMIRLRSCGARLRSNGPALPQS
jgi:hypothetical protein